jgi:2-polyprenyl-3-methyl-5-hydroxy-6-metoxy-1,4-benzoquinol methylase
MKGPGAVSAPRSEYEWSGSAHAHNHAVLMPAIRRALGAPLDRRLLDLGCGNGALTAALAGDGFKVVGFDVAQTGIAQAKAAHPDLIFHLQDVAEPLLDRDRKRFDIVLSAEVIEHLLLPRQLFHRAIEALTDEGVLILTTPYHGWFKNLALAFTNRFDRHWNPAWDYGHVKFFSRTTLADLAEECGFQLVGFHRVGRIPPLAMSMLLVLRRAG